MFITKKCLPRRTFLRGMGAVVALPFLDAMVPAGTALAQTAARPTLRMGFVYFPHGAVMDFWTPDVAGSAFELKPILKPLEPFRQQLTIVSGLANRPAMLPPVHAIQPGTWLSCVEPEPSQNPRGGVTLDQMVADHLGQGMPFPSIEVATEARGGGSGCDRNYGCSYSGTISFRTPTTPLPMEHNPRNLFQRLFGQGDTPEERATIARQTSSILDVVSEESAALKRGLGAADRAMLDDYLQTIREIERRVQSMEARDLSALDLPDAPGGPPNAFDEHLNLMFDLVALAYQANLTNVFSMMMAAEVSNLTYNHIGVSDAFHPLSHHKNDPALMERLSRIQIYHTEVFAKFVTKLAAMPDGDGSMLDHTMLLYGSNMSNSNAHDEFPLPSAVVGGGNGTLTGNQHLVYPDHTPLANLMLTLAHRAGLPGDTLGDSTGEISEL